VSSDEKQLHIEAARKFLGFIDMGMMPDIADPTYDNASSLYPEGYGNTVVLGHEVYASLERLAQAREQKKQAEAVEELIKGELAMLLQDAEYGAIDGTQVVSWKNSSRTSFDTKKFEAEHPALAEKFRKTSTFRTMRIIAKGAK
jgi:predicted phage-related endonuclease